MNAPSACRGGLFAAAVALAVAACRASVPADAPYVSKDEYLDLVEAAVAAYDDGHIAEYVADSDANGVNEHGFPRLAANIGTLISAGRMQGRRDLFRRMMSICCRDAKKGMMTKEGNEFSVKELVAALLEVERAGIFDRSVTDAWRRDLAAVDPWRCYRVKPEVGDTTRSYNWCVFGCASEQARIAAGVGGDASFVDRYIADQCRWFDGNGMWRDPHEPAVYDLVTRLQFALALSMGYDGPARARLEEFLDRAAEPTLALQSAAGEIPFGGRSNQFLHNDTIYAALCEWYAARAMKRGDAKLAARFRAGARRAVDSLKAWLAAKPVRHVKNRYPRGTGKRGTGIGCEGYAYFDKYMVTMGSWAILARRFADESVPSAVEDGMANPSSFATTPFFHWVFLRAGDYSAQFDYNSDTHYDCDGLGRLHRRGAPTAICLSTPCAAKPSYLTELANEESLAFAPAGGDALVPDGNGHDKHSAWANWKVGTRLWKCRLTEKGLESTLTGDGALAMRLPAFEFDGESGTEVSCIGKSLVVRYRGWVCSYVTDGTLADTGRTCCNRNGRYRVFEARGKGSLSVTVAIRKEGVCLCGEAPERAHDFFWENDRTGFRAYGPGDVHKWSGIDVFNKATAANLVVRFLRRLDKVGNWHKNVKGLGMDDYAVGPGRGVGGVAFRKNGEWLADYGNWTDCRVLANGDERCAFELDYRLPFGGKMTLGISLKRGSSLFEETVSFSPGTPLDGVEVGVGLDLNAAREHTGDLFVDREKGIVSLFEKPHGRPGEEGSMMNAVCAIPGRGAVAMADEPNGAKMLMTRPLSAADANGKPVIAVLAGADWTEAGRFRTAAEWHRYVTDYRKEQK